MKTSKKRKKKQRTQLQAAIFAATSNRDGTLRIRESSIPNDRVNQENFRNASNKGKEKAYLGKRKGKRKEILVEQDTSDSDADDGNNDLTTNKGNIESGDVDEDSSQSNTDEEETDQPDINKKKKVRGVTRLDILPVGEKQRQTVEWNEVGQPIGKASVRFSTALGVLVRQYIPINVDNWKKVDDQKKNELWTLLLV